LFPLAAVPLSVRNASGFPQTRFKQRGYAAEAESKNVLTKYGKPQAFREENGTADL
jgi:hypothetical protein